jgi:hypothetical protein
MVITSRFSPERTSATTIAAVDLVANAKWSYPGRRRRRRRDHHNDQGVHFKKPAAQIEPPGFDRSFVMSTVRGISSGAQLLRPYPVFNRRVVPAMSTDTDLWCRRGA